VLPFYKSTVPPQDAASAEYVAFLRSVQTSILLSDHSRHLQTPRPATLSIYQIAAGWPYSAIIKIPIYKSQKPDFTTRSWEPARLLAI
jgi:hypothetical protein